MKTLLQFIVLFYSCCGFNVFSSDQNLSANEELNDVVDNICDKKMVLLGEDSNHGSGKTLEIKVVLVKRLIDECNFSAIFFESSIYEFINLEESLQTNKSTEKQLAESIGGIWSTTKQIQPLISYLYRKAEKGEVKLFGIDAQFSANQPFTQKKLPKRLAKYLSGIKSQVCENELYQYLNWQYDKTNPYNDETKKRISLCIIEIQTGLNKLQTKDSTIDQFMADNFAKYLEFELKNHFNLRDKAMSENILWHLSRLKNDEKTIVWSATIHVAKTLSSISKTKIPMGYYIHKRLKNQVVSIGFSALTGQFGRDKSNLKLIEEGNLEQHALVSKKYIGYLDSTDLKRLGSISAHPINYTKIKSVNWADVLDGIVVLRQELPLEYIQ